MLNAAPSATTGPIRAAWVWMSQFAVFIACQMPVKFGLPSLVRGTCGAWAIVAAPAAATIAAAASASVPTRYRISFPRFRTRGGNSNQSRHLQRGRLFVGAGCHRSADLDRLPDEHGELFRVAVESIDGGRRPPSVAEEVRRFGVFLTHAADDHEAA